MKHHTLSPNSRMIGLLSNLVCIVLISACTSSAPHKSTQAHFDVVLSGGRVMDPETGLDDIRNVGITNDKIEAISADALNGDETIDVSGLVVAPGFIDLHSHSPTPLPKKLKH